VAFIPIEGIDTVKWYVGVVLDKEQAFAPINKARDQSLYLGMGGLTLAMVALLMLVRRLMRPVHALTRAIREISLGDGDLTQRIEIDSEDEIGVLSANFNQFLDTIHHSMREVNQAAMALNNSISQVRDTTNSSLQMSQEQLSRSGNVATAVSELGMAAQEMTSNAANASSLTGDIQLQAQQGLEALKDNISAMDVLSVSMTDSSEQIDRLSDQTTNIDNILEVIKGISSQTNLLALNAAIEAARAGEAGRGFSVVADEVRQLAQRTSESTQEIAGLITNLQQGADAAVQTMQSSQTSSTTSVDMARHAGQKMDDIQHSLVAIDKENNGVAERTRQQEGLIGGIDEEMVQLNNLDQQRADCLDQTMSACDELQQQFDRLDTLVKKFKV
jgi:methyl-accepting chemotaxis protein